MLKPLSLSQKDTSEVLLNHTAAGLAYSFDEPNLISSTGLVPVMRLASLRDFTSWLISGSRLPIPVRIKARTQGPKSCP